LKACYADAGSLLGNPTAAPNAAMLFKGFVN
jgi:hypothetical protein